MATYGKKNMNRLLATGALLIAGLLGMTACASEPPVAAPGDAPSTSQDSQVAEQPSAEETAGAVQSETIMPSGARPGSADFPFPVPADWTDLDAFVEEKIGKSRAMSANFSYTGDANAAAAIYRQLLEEAGYVIHANPLGEQVHAASFIAEGPVAGVQYKGTLDFDTDAAGTQRVVINLTEE